jgi:hypothetical protein
MSIMKEYKFITIDMDERPLLSYSERLTKLCNDEASDGWGLHTYTEILNGRVVRLVLQRDKK